MKIKITKSDNTEEEIQNVQAVIYDKEEKLLRVHWMKQSTIYLLKADPRDFPFDMLLAFMVEEK